MTRKIDGLARVIGHRGAMGHAPENTIASIRRAAALGAAWVEVDVRLTADKRLVLMHDATLERTTDGEGLVEEATLTEIAALDAGGWYAPEFAGERVPALEEFIEGERYSGEVGHDTPVGGGCVKAIRLGRLARRAHCRGSPIGLRAASS